MLDRIGREVLSISTCVIIFHGSKNAGMSEY